MSIAEKHGRKISGAIIILIGISYMAIINYKGKLSYDTFYSSKTNSLIIERDNWQRRATEFYLQDGIQIDSSSITGNELDLKLNDSIVKNANSNQFKVYRKTTTGHFKLIHTYTYDY